MGCYLFFSLFLSLFCFFPAFGSNVFSKLEKRYLFPLFSFGYCSDRCCTTSSHKMGYVMSIWFSNRLSSIITCFFLLISSILFSYMKYGNRGSKLHDQWNMVYLRTSNNNNSKIKTADAASGLFGSIFQKSLGLYFIWIIISFFIMKNLIWGWNWIRVQILTHRLFYL